MLTEVSGTILYTFHTLNNLIVANMLEIGTISFLLQMRKKKCRKVKQLVKSHTAGKRI